MPYQRDGPNLASPRLLNATNRAAFARSPAALGDEPTRAASLGTNRRQRDGPI